MDKTMDALHLTEITPDEKSWLDERLSELSVKEHLILNGLLVYAPPQSGMDMVNLIQNIQDCDICFDVGNEEGLGAFVAREIEGVPQKYMSFLDFNKIAAEYTEQHPGVFSDGNYVELPDNGLQIYYDGLNLHECKDDSWSVKLKLTAAGHPEGVWLRLPDYQEANDGKPDEIEIALTALEAANVDECLIADYKCILPRAGDLILQYDSITDLIYDGNNLGFVLDERGQGMPNFLELYHAALEFEDCGTLSEALDIAENLNRYDLVPVSQLREYAEKEFVKQGVKLSESSAAAFDFERFATVQLEVNGYSLRDDGKAFIGKRDSMISQEQANGYLPGMILG